MKNLKVRIFVRHLYKVLALVLFFFSFFAVSNAQTTVKAQTGDGIYSLLKRHGLSPSEYMDQFIDLNKANLGRNNSLFVGRSYKLPDAGAAVSSAISENSPGGTAYAIFGSRYKVVSREDSQLAGTVYYLVSGHGGPDPGAIGHLGSHMLCEDEYAYDVTLRLARNLLEHGALVYMIVRDENDGIRDESLLRHDRDEVCYPALPIPRSQVGRLRQRKDAVNTLYAKNRNKVQRLVEIHIDSRSKGQNIDVFFYHDKRSTTGKKLALNLHQTFKQKYDYHQPNRGYQGTVSDRNLYMLKYSYPPAVFIELGNINHTRDQQRFMISDNRQAIANWLAEGLIKDFQNNR